MFVFLTIVLLRIKIFFAGLGSFPNGQIKEVPCTEHQHCKIECRDRPNCFPDSKCRVEWKIGEGTKTNVEINKRVVVDGKGVCITSVDHLKVDRSSPSKYFFTIKMLFLFQPL